MPIIVWKGLNGSTVPAARFFRCDRGTVIMCWLIRSIWIFADRIHLSAAAAKAHGGAPENPLGSSDNSFIVARHQYLVLSRPPPVLRQFGWEASFHDRIQCAGYYHYGAANQHCRRNSFRIPGQGITCYSSVSGVRPSLLESYNTFITSSDSSKLRHHLLRLIKCILAVQMVSMEALPAAVLACCCCMVCSYDDQCEWYH